MTKNFKAISLFMLILIAVGIICSCGGNGVETDLGVNSDTTSQDTVIDSNPNKPVTSDTETEISSDLITDTSTDTNTDISADSNEIIDTENGDNGNGNNPEDNYFPNDNGSNEDLWTGNKQ